MDVSSGDKSMSDGITFTEELAYRRSEIINDFNNYTIKKRFVSKSEAIKQKIVYVYCPVYAVPSIKNLAKHHQFEIVMNDYSIDNLDKCVICHFESFNLNDEQQKFLIKAIKLGAWVEPLVSYIDNRCGYTEIDILHNGYFLHQKAFSLLSTRKTLMTKRLIDLLSCLLLLPFAIPLGIFTAILIKLESPGPIFFKQKRTGLYNEEFEVIKFRSMCNDAEKSGAQWAKVNDTRVTTVGKFIRKTRIDELPQIINILKGEMSIIGPRPEREVFIKDLEKQIPFYRFRHAVKPGVTGLAQVCYPYGASVEDAKWKHKYDIYYIKHHSTTMDLKILLKTVKTVICGMGR